MDRLGSVVAMSDTSGEVLEQYRYSPYGVPGWEGPAGFPFRFTGQKLDPETGLYYYKARYYDPETGRFLQTDPIGYEDQMNLYAYVGNDPVNAIDPTGMCSGSRLTNSDGTCISTGGFTTGTSGAAQGMRREDVFQEIGARFNPNSSSRTQINSGRDIVSETEEVLDEIGSEIGALSDEEKKTEWGGAAYYDNGSVKRTELMGGTEVDSNPELEDFLYSNYSNILGYIHNHPSGSPWGYGDRGTNNNITYYGGRHPDLKGIPSICKIWTEEHGITEC